MSSILLALYFFLFYHIYMEPLYKQLIQKKALLNKEAYLYQQEYYRVFSDSLTAIYTKQYQTVCLNKKIEYLKQHPHASQEELNAYVNEETKEDYKKLYDLLYTIDCAKKHTTITFSDYKNIENVYQSILYKTSNQEILDKAYVAYIHNDLKSLQDIDKNTIEEKKFIYEDMDILQKDISTIQNTIPYQYKYILISKEKTALHEDDLSEEIEELDLYIQQLEKELEQY